MRHPIAFKAVALVGAAILGFPATAGALASGYPDFQKWSQDKFEEAAPMMLSPLFWPAIIVAFVIYCGILLYCGTGAGRTPTLEELTDDEYKTLKARHQAAERFSAELAAPKAADDLEIGMGDHYENHGTVHGNMGPTYYGKQSFQLSEPLMVYVAEQLGQPRTLGIHWVGSQKSAADAQTLAAFLRSRGFSVEDRGGIGMLVPQLATPIEVRGDVIFVDSDK